MASGELGYFDYLKEAFAWRHRLPLLGRLPLNYLGIAAFAVLGLANPGFLLLGAAAEVAYLAVAAGNPRFQKVIDARRMTNAQHQQDQRIEQTLARLGTKSRQRYAMLLAQCREVLGISAALDDGGLQSIQHMRTGGLNQLLWIFVRLLTSRELLTSTVARTDRAAVAAEVAELETRIQNTAEDSTLGRSLRGSHEIQSKRLENLDRAETNLTVIDAELGRIEHQVALLREETAVSGKAEVLSQRLDTVTGALHETNRWMEQHAEIFGALDVDLGSEAGLPELPALEVESQR